MARSRRACPARSRRNHGECLLADALRSFPASGLTWLGYPTGVQFIVKLPDELARQVIPVGSGPARIAVEDMAVEAYRAGRLTEHQLATLLGMDRYELDGFLKKREVWLDYTEGDLRREVEVGERLWKKRQDELDPSGQ
jgi:hypothetical protein